ncbi:toprim domain-containing protein, partial [bacterium]|nr:toprim domain-containing protein [bacterium]
MQLQGLTFREAVDMLAERFHIPLQEDEKIEKGISSLQLQDALSFASQFYHFYLQRTEEGRVALNYLTKRGLSLEFIRRFQIGYAPEGGALFLKAMHEKKFSVEIMIAAGLLNKDGDRPFFRERITFPVHNARGSVIAFSARKIKEETFGGKYINTSETQLFKKSRHLFGLNYSRKRIVKEQRAMLVEGQIDCLRLIEAGFDYAVAALGTAFGEGHVDTLKNLGVRSVTIAFDADKAGIEATLKTGALFQKVGIEVEVLLLPEGMDPDSFLQEKGKEEFEKLPTKDYLTFCLLKTKLDLKSPAGKAQFVRDLSLEIKTWNDPVMVHESLQK